MSVVEEHDSVAAIAVEWDALADRVAAPPFLRPGWFEAWLGSFAVDRPLILAVREGERLTGVLPLVLDGRRARAAANTHSPRFGALTEGPEAAARIAAHLAGRRLARLDLLSLDPSDALLPALRESWRGRFVELPAGRSPYVVLDGDFDAYRAGLARKFRKEVERHKRRLAELGELTFEFSDGGDGWFAALDEGFALEGSSWKVEEGTAILSKPHRIRFYRELCEWARRRGWLQLAFARLDGRAIAFDLCLQHDGNVYALKGGFDTELRKHGPGLLLTYESIANAYAARGGTYELLGDADDYKLNFTGTSRERLHTHAFARSPSGRAAYFGHRRVRPLVRRIRG